METTNEESVPLVSFAEPIWVLQARDGTKVYFDPDPMGTDAWAELLQLRADVEALDEDDHHAVPGILARLQTVLGSFAMDVESADAWKRSLPDLGLAKCLTLMKVYNEKVTDLPT